jgi:RHS repeat-associated protein
MVSGSNNDPSVHKRSNSSSRDKDHQDSSRHNNQPEPRSSTTTSSPVLPQPPAISIPKGGGAIRDIGEKFNVNAATGTGSLTVPITTSTARNGSAPQFTLTYDSGHGNGPFGLGWHLSLPTITRKTDKGLPRYQDVDESDVFILSGAEDLVPVFQVDQSGKLTLDGSGSPVYDETQRDGYAIRRYRPRVDALFARIERWTRQSDGDIHWRSISRDNVTTLYGKDHNSRIACPSDSTNPGPPRIFSWLICQTFDTKGNATIYEYKGEDSASVPTWQANEQHRTDQTRSAGRYLKRVRYGNQIPNRDPIWTASDPSSLPNQDWMFQLVFDYGEHDVENPSPQETNPWACRDDPISTYRSGFEVRTYRLCRRALMFHYFPDELGPKDRLVQATEFSYDHGPVITFMTQVVHSGYVLQQDQGQQPQYIKRSLAPLEFEYSEPPTPDQLVQLPVRTIDADSTENLPYGVDGSSYSWVDLDGEGAAGIFTEQSEGWFYKRNMSASNRVIENGAETTIARFGAMERISDRPAADARASQFMDLAGDGQMDLVQMNGFLHGFYKRSTDDDWLSFRSFSSWPNIDTQDANLKFIDLNGDGFADILIAQNDLFTWYPSLAEDGFGPAVEVSQQIDGNEGPRLVFADSEGAVYLADVSGDGLNDLVRIRNGEVTYWPNLGYGYFGSRVIMDNAPWFDHSDQFNQSRIRIADIDGSGTADIIYLGRESVDIYRNQAGNGWSLVDRLQGLPPGDQLSSVSTTDLLGTGTTCLVWSSPLTADARQPMHYVDLMNGVKPHLLVKFVNNMGAETQIQYVPSTYFYEKDRDEGKPWVTRLSFPVQCVHRVDTFDLISRNHFVTRYAYHHGFFDGIEREFNGFGMVEQWDTEDFGTLNNDSTSSTAANFDVLSNVPPVYTKTWFHTGAFFNQDVMSRQMAHEYYGAPASDEQQFEQFWNDLLEETVLPSAQMTADEIREASRALKGFTLRQEVYAQDGSTKQSIPYLVTEGNQTVEFVQPQGINLYSIFFTRGRESIQHHYERNLDDPRVSHKLTLEVDRFGNVLRSIEIGYGRRPGRSTLQGEDTSKQEQLLIIYTEEDFTNAVEEVDNYCTPVSCEIREYEVSGFTLPPGETHFAFPTFAADNFASLNTLTEIPFEQDNNPNLLQKRLIKRSRTLYRSNDLSRLLPLAQLESMRLPGASYRLALTPGLIVNVYQRGSNGTSPENLLPNSKTVLGGTDDGQAGLVDIDNNGFWWVPSGRVFYHPDVNATFQQELMEGRGSFFSERRFTDPFNNSSFAELDANHLLPVRTQDSLGNIVTCVNDYRVLEPILVTDPNGNRTAAAYDARGFLAGTAVMGKTTENLGDHLDGFRVDLPQDAIDQFLSQPDDPQITASLLGNATSRIVYDVTRYWQQPDPEQKQPVFAATLSRETHVSDPLPQEGLKIQVAFAYSDGFARDIQHKVQAEAGAVDGLSGVVSNRWVGTGWTIYNNKGHPVRQYEPFFDDTHEFKFNSIKGVSPVLFYDAMQRSVATLHPDHSWDKIILDPWQQTSYDTNDTVLMDPESDSDVGYFFSKLPAADYQPTWYNARIRGQMGPKENSAATKTTLHANTPSVQYFDSLGRTFLTVVDNGSEGKYESRSIMDIEGNQREVIDAKGRVVMRYDYDMLNTHIHQSSMEAGERWTLNNAVANVLMTWNSRNFRTRTGFDALHRPVATYLQAGAGPEQQVERTVYGEMLPAPEVYNQRGKSVLIYDQAGLVTNDEYDFKGNLLQSQRNFAQDYKTPPDWSTVVPMEALQYVTSTRYDALSRVVELTAPDKSVTRLIYSKASLLDQVHVNIHGKQVNGEPSFTSFVENIDYNAKGQRTLIEYGNGVNTVFSYDPITFRLTDLQTQRTGQMLQDFHYTYDPVANITQIDDNAQQTIFFRNRRVEPSAEYTYSAVYQLIAATGREHLGLSSNGLVNAPRAPDASNDYQTRLVHPGDGKALGNYYETYVYDAVNNLLAMKHASSDPSKPGFTRTYAYKEKSQLEPSKTSNRLSSTTVGSSSEKYSYDGSAGLQGMMSLPHLSSMEWDYRDHLHSTSRQIVNNGTPETTWYVYNTSGDRARKVTERQAGTGETPTRLKERIYLGVFEVYREYASDGTTIQLERETLNVMEESAKVAVIETRTVGQDSSPSRLTRYQLVNHLGTAQLELDDAAQIISYEEYYPFGSTSYQAVRSQLETPKRYRYTGKERDEETGLYYHGLRYYACWLGRWTSCDPKDLADGDNLYQYVKNNPICHSDPTGAITWGQAAGFGAALVVGTLLTVATAGLAAPLGVAAAAVIAGAVGGAAAGAVSAAVESKIDHGEVNIDQVKHEALVGAATGALLGGGGKVISALAKTRVGGAVGKAVFGSAPGKFVATMAQKSINAVSKGASAASSWASKTGVGKAVSSLAAKEGVQKAAGAVSAGVEKYISKPLMALHDGAAGLTAKGRATLARNAEFRTMVFEGTPKV